MLKQTCKESFAATKPPEVSFTFHCNFVLSSVGVSEDLHVDGHLSDGIVHPRA